MPDLTQQSCTACRGDEPPLGDALIAALAPQVPDWAILERDGVKRLERVFRFQNFAQALAFSNRVGAAAEAEGHHPAILTEWGRVTVGWWTHKIRGLHRNDFIMAAKTDALYKEATVTVDAVAAGTTASTSGTDPAPTDSKPSAQGADATDPAPTYSKPSTDAADATDPAPTDSKPSTAATSATRPALTDPLGLPGQFPFTRGIYPDMYRDRLWTMRQYAGYASAEESNARYRYLLAQGQTGLSVAFDLPTQIGFDPDHPLALGEVGRVGVSIASLADMEQLFAGIPLDRVTTSMTINATAPVLLALYMAVAKKQGVALKDIGGTTQNDILKEYIARGTYIYPPAASLRLVTDMFDFATRQLPRWHPISISGYHVREAGATAVQELAFTLANGIQYVKAAVERGLAPDDFMGRLSFFFAAQNNLLEEVAKFRAARRMWAHIARDRFGARLPASQMLRFHTQTAGVTLTAQQPMNNVTRVTIQALAAVLGGTQSLHTNSMDEALGLPTQEAVTVALRTQQIIGYESGVAEVVDPLAGSFAVEKMTDDLEREAAALIGRIDAMGGALAAIERGWVAAQIAESAYRYQRAVESGAVTVVGVNRFTEDAAPPPDVLRVDPATEARRVAAVRALRATRDAMAVEGALRGLGEAARGSGNVLPAILAAVEAYATMGEICDCLRKEFGEYRGVEMV